MSTHFHLDAIPADCATSPALPGLIVGPWPGFGIFSTFHSHDLLTLKTYALYFYAGLVTLLVEWSPVLPFFWGLYLVWFPFLVHIIGAICRCLFIYSIVRMTREFKEPLGTRVLFYPMVLSVWIYRLLDLVVTYYFYFASDNRFVFDEFYQHLGSYLSGLYYVGLVLGIVGGFLVRDKVLRGGFRVWAYCSIPVGVVQVLQRLHYHSPGSPWFLILPTLQFIPLLYLNFRLWRKNDLNLAAEIDAIGQPEKPTP